jgi:hypothetical protein
MFFRFESLIGDSLCFGVLGDGDLAKQVDKEGKVSDAKKSVSVTPPLTYVVVEHA